MYVDKQWNPTADASFRFDPVGVQADPSMINYSPKSKTVYGPGQTAPKGEPTMSIIPPSMKAPKGFGMGEDRYGVGQDAGDGGGALSAIGMDASGNFTGTPSFVSVDEDSSGSGDPATVADNPQYGNSDPANVQDTGVPTTGSQAPAAKDVVTFVYDASGKVIGTRDPINQSIHYNSPTQPKTGPATTTINGQSAVWDPNKKQYVPAPVSSDLAPKKKFQWVTNTAQKTSDLFDMANPTVSVARKNRDGSITVNPAFANDPEVAAAVGQVQGGPSSGQQGMGQGVAQGGFIQTGPGGQGVATIPTNQSAPPPSGGGGGGNTLQSIINAAAAKYNVPASALAGIWKKESGGSFPNPYVNPQGYGGLFGTSQADAQSKGFSLTDPGSAQQQADQAASVLAKGLQVGGNIQNALAYYNTGKADASAAQQYVNDVLGFNGQLPDGPIPSSSGGGGFSGGGGGDIGGHFVVDSDGNQHWVTDPSWEQKQLNDGRTVLFNPKTGEYKPLPGGLGDPIPQFQILGNQYGSVDSKGHFTAQGTVPKDKQYQQFGNKVYSEDPTGLTPVLDVPKDSSYFGLGRSEYAYDPNTKQASIIATDQGPYQVGDQLFVPQDQMGALQSGYRQDLKFGQGEDGDPPPETTGDAWLRMRDQQMPEVDPRMGAKGNPGRTDVVGGSLGSPLINGIDTGSDDPTWRYMNQSAADLAGQSTKDPWFGGMPPSRNSQVAPMPGQVPQQGFGGFDPTAFNRGGFAPIPQGLAPVGGFSPVPQLPGSGGFSSDMGPQTGVRNLGNDYYQQYLAQLRDRGMGNLTEAQQGNVLSQSAQRGLGPSVPVGQIGREEGSNVSSGPTRIRYRPDFGQGEDPVSPVAPQDVAGIGTRFGQPGAFTGQPHDAVDIQTAKGTPLRAPIDGIAHVEKHKGGGIVVVIEDATGQRHELAHMLSAMVQDGQRVKKGQIVGQAGESGDTVSGPVVHWAQSQNGQPQDPTPALGAQGNLPPNPNTAQPMGQGEDVVGRIGMFTDRRFAPYGVGDDSLGAGVAMASSPSGMRDARQGPNGQWFDAGAISPGPLFGKGATSPSGMRNGTQGPNGLWYDAVSVSSIGSPFSASTPGATFGMGEMYPRPTGQQSMLTAKPMGFSPTGSPRFGVGDDSGSYGGGFDTSGGGGDTSGGGGGGTGGGAPAPSPSPSPAPIPQPQPSGGGGGGGSTGWDQGQPGQVWNGSQWVDPNANNTPVGDPSTWNTYAGPNEQSPSQGLGFDTSLQQPSQPTFQPVAPQPMPSNNFVPMQQTLSPTTTGSPFATNQNALATNLQPANTQPTTLAPVTPLAMDASVLGPSAAPGSGPTNLNTTFDVNNPQPGFYPNSVIDQQGGQTNNTQPAQSNQNSTAWNGGLPGQVWSGSNWVWPNQNFSPVSSTSSGPPAPYTSTPSPTNQSQPPPNQQGENQVVQTANGPKTIAQMRQELTAAGNGQAATMPAQQVAQLYNATVSGASKNQVPALSQYQQAQIDLQKLGYQQNQAQFQSAQQNQNMQMLWQSALSNPWLQALGGLAPAWNSPGGPNLAATTGGLDPNTIPSWQQIQSASPFVRAAWMTSRMLNTGKTFQDVINEARGTWGAQGGTVPPDMTQLQAQGLNNVGQIGAGQLAQGMGQDPSAYFTNQQRNWDVGRGSAVSGLIG